MKKILSNPITVFIGIIVGVTIGVFYKPMVPYLKPIGDGYLALLVLCILPILFASIVIGLSKLIQSPHIKDEVIRILIVFVLGSVLVSGIGMCIVWISMPALHLHPRAEVNLGKRLKKIAVYPPVTQRTSEITEPVTVLRTLFKKFIPNNLFENLSQGMSVEFLLATLLIGR